MAETITTSWHEAGRAKGRVEYARDLLLRHLSRRFGPLPPDLVERVRSITEEVELDGLIERLMDGASLQELGLDQVTVS